MAGKRLSMRKIKEILRLRWGEGLSLRKVADSIGGSPSTVFDFECRAKAAVLTWPLAGGLDDDRLEKMLFATESPSSTKSEPNFEEIHREMKRKGVTLSLLWHEYKLAHPDDGYQYSRFCELYRRWQGKLDVVMRQEHTRHKPVRSPVPSTASTSLPNPFVMNVRAFTEYNRSPTRRCHPNVTPRRARPCRRLRLRLPRIPRWRQ